MGRETREGIDLVVLEKKCTAHHEALEARTRHLIAASIDYLDPLASGLIPLWASPPGCWKAYRECNVALANAHGRRTPDE